MSPQPGSTGGAASILARLLSVSACERPWAQITAAFNAMDAAAVTKNLCERPEIFSGHIDESLEAKQLPTVHAAVRALTRATCEITDFGVIAALSVAAAVDAAAKEMVQAIGGARVVKAGIGLCKAPVRVNPDLGARALIGLCEESDPVGILAPLARGLPALCEALPERGESNAAWAGRYGDVCFRVFFAACKAVTVLIQAGTEIPELEKHIATLAAFPASLPGHYGQLDNLLLALIDVSRVLKEKSKAGPFVDARGRRQTLPGARALIFSLANCIGTGCVMPIQSSAPDFARDQFNRRESVVKALRIFPADEVADVVISDLLPDPVEQAKRERPGCPAGWGAGALCCYAGALRTASEFLIADPSSTGSSAVFDYCRRVFRVRTEECPRPLWPLSILQMFGAAGVDVIREFQVETDQGELGNWSFEAERVTASALALCTPEEAAPHLRTLLDERLGPDFRLCSSAGRKIPYLNKDRTIEFSLLVLDELESKPELAAEHQAALLEHLSGFNRHGRFVISPRTYKRIVDAALARRQAGNTAIRREALRLLARIVWALPSREDPPGIADVRRIEIADAMALGFGDPEEDIRESMRSHLSRDTHNLRPELALPLLKAACQNPKNGALLQELQETCELPANYWSEAMIGLRSDYMCWIKDALVGRIKVLRDCAAILFPWVLAHAGEELRQELLVWLEGQMKLARARRRRVLRAVLRFARYCPELAGRHEWILTAVAKCGTWSPAEKLDVCFALCARNPAGLAQFIKGHGLDFSSCAGASLSAPKLEALMLAVC